MESREIVQVKADEDVAACDGGGGVLGHPKVYLRFEGRQFVDCYYCSLRFVKPNDPAGAAA